MGCSTRLNAPPVSSPSIMKRTPRPGRRTTVPSPGPSRRPTVAVIAGTSFRWTPRPSIVARYGVDVNPSSMVSNQMAEKRKYELKKRAERLADTRRRITEATVELHRTVGPAATQINEIARRAGVQRMTVYNHFPDESSLLTACSAHWRALHPSPDLAQWRAVVAPGARLRRGLRELYAWYRETEPMTDRKSTRLNSSHTVISYAVF